MTNETIMLAKEYTPKNIDPTAEYVITEKIDGQPCKIFREDGILKAVSRQGKPITSIEHILYQLDKYGDVPEGKVIVGELHITGLSCTEISGKVRKDEACTDLTLYVFPEFEGEDATYLAAECVQYMDEMILSGTDLIRYLSPDNEQYVTVDNITKLTEIFIIHSNTIIDPVHFEGFIARKLPYEWTAGKRSKDYVKIIATHTLDLKVTGMQQAQSKDGKLLGRIGAFLCEWNSNGDNDGTCTVGAGKLSHKEAARIWEEGCIGKIIQVKHKPDVHYKTPRQPTFQMFREDKDTYQTDF